MLDQFYFEQFSLAQVHSLSVKTVVFRAIQLRSLNVQAVLF